jgi:hypothetical protein
MKGVLKAAERAIRAAGKWSEFINHVGELEGRGVETETAIETALGKVMETLPEPVKPSKKEAPHEAVTSIDREEPNRVEPGEPLLSPGSDSKAAGAAACIRWVARNMHRKNVKETDAPDMMAYNLMMACRKDRIVAASFWNNSFTRLIEKADLDDGSGKVDGQETMELIDKIIEIGVRAAKAAAK